MSAHGINVAWAVLIVLVSVACGPVLDRWARQALGVERTAWRSRGLAVGLLAGAGSALSCLLVGADARLPAFVYLALVGAAICRTDITAHRIPDALNVALLSGGAILLGLAAWASQDLALALRAAAGSACCFLVLLATALISPAAMGMGDVKLAASVGLYLGFLGWPALMAGLAGSFILAAVVGVVLALVRVATRSGARTAGLRDALQRAIAFGPFLLAGIAVAALW